MTGGRVVILGPTGRNFGAGMSGGIAYVYDADDRFASLVNYDMVTLDELGEADLAFLRTTIERHRELTGSAVADRVIGDWDTEITRFRKVMPIDYKRVLNVIEVAEADGLDEEQTVERIMEAARS
jgi:glutamate synthase (NADPH/NADH) large chain